MEGLFSIKSDVFAFGVLLLEIISGKKNTGFRNSDCLSLLGHVGLLLFLCSCLKHGIINSSCVGALLTRKIVEI